MDRARRALNAFYAFLDRPLYLWSRPLLLALVVPLIVGMTMPLWHIHMEAPQYPTGLDVDIYAYTIKGGRDGNDLKEINILNHYIGMKKIDRAALTDLDWLPFGFGVLALLALRVAALGNVRSMLDLSTLVAYFSVFSLARFYLKLYAYGHDLSPEAPVKIEPFMPALLGSKQVGNFTTHAGPSPGTYLVGAFAAGVLALTFVHLFKGRRAATHAGAQAAASGDEGLQPTRSTESAK
ncbi:MAG: hypothetical protein MUF34_17975 [Polyangiaceae bacterium]|jgi:hypothetical protein|nr:hypothetical protein [Polyangiaceae bacterium]